MRRKADIAAQGRGCSNLCSEVSEDRRGPISVFADTVFAKLHTRARESNELIRFASGRELPRTGPNFASTGGLPPDRG